MAQLTQCPRCWLKYVERPDGMCPKCKSEGRVSTSSLLQSAVPSGAAPHAPAPAASPLWPDAVTPAFCARAAFTWKPDCEYRVFVTPTDVVFIKIAGQGGLGDALAAQMGLLGMLWLALTKKSAEKKRASLLAELARHAPHSLLVRDRKNFSVPRTALLGQQFLPCRWFHDQAQAGRWCFGIQGRERMELFIPTTQDMATALGSLQSLPGVFVDVQIAWDQKKQRYVQRAR